MNDLLNERAKMVQRVIDLLTGANNQKILHNFAELDKVVCNLEKQSDLLIFQTKHYAAPAEMRHV